MLSKFCLARCFAFDTVSDATNLCRLDIAAKRRCLVLDSRCVDQVHVGLHTTFFGDNCDRALALLAMILSNRLDLLTPQ